MFHNVGLSWMIELKGQYKLAVDETFIDWCNKKNLNPLGPIFEEFFVTARQDRYDLICGLEAY